MPEKQPTKAELKSRRRAEKDRQKAVTTRREITRRNLLKGLGGLGAAVALGGISYLANRAEPQPDKPLVTSLLSEPLILQKQPSLSYNVNRRGSITVETPTPLQLDKNYLFELLASLNKPETNIDLVNTTVNNLALVRTQTPGGTTGTNALMLDESGIYLTCGHTFIENKLDHERSTPESSVFYFNPINQPASVINPALMKRYPITEYISDPSTELAIFYAPTGFKRKPSGVKFSTDQPSAGQDLWQTSLFLSESGATFHVMHGVVEGEEKTSDLSYVHSYKGRVRISGMIPFGSSSGSPILDNFGRIVAVESGFIPKPGTDLSQPIPAEAYVGSTAAPITKMSEVLQNQTKKQLPR